ARHRDRSAAVREPHAAAHRAGPDAGERQVVRLPEAPGLRLPGHRGEGDEQLVLLAARHPQPPLDPEPARHPPAAALLPGPRSPRTPSPSPTFAPTRRTGRSAVPSTHTSTRYFSARTRSPPRTLAPTLWAAAPTPVMISTAASSLSVVRFPLSGTPSETRAPSGVAPSAARSDSAAAAARQPISGKLSQSVRKWTSSRLASQPP